MVVISVLLATLLVVLLLAVDVVIGAELVESVNPLWSSDVEFIIADVVSFITRAEYGAKIIQIQKSTVHIDTIYGNQPAQKH